MKGIVRPIKPILAAASDYALSFVLMQAGVEKAKNDVALNVAVAYLQILLAREQVNLPEAAKATGISYAELCRRIIELSLAARPTTP